MSKTNDPSGPATYEPPSRGGLDSATVKAQIAAAVRLRGTAAVKGAPERYVGLTTRLLGFVVDALLINLVALATWAVVALTISALKIPDDVRNLIIVILGGCYIVWSIAYFIAFWTSTGQTPGARALEFRVVNAKDGRPIRTGRALLRFAGMILGALPLFAGYIVGLFDARCRCLPDLFGDSVVIDAPVFTVADRRRMAREAAANKYKPRHSGAAQQSRARSDDDA